MSDYFETKMNFPATNRQKKLLRFFEVQFGEKITLGAAGWEIGLIMSNEANREKWKKYLYVTSDLDDDSDALKSFERNSLEEIKIPEEWSAWKAIQEYRSEVVAEFLKNQTPFDAPEPQLHFEKRHFAFTGTFDFGTRNECENAVIQRGGFAPKWKFLSATIDYLVIGTKGSKTWKHGSYGNKIETAILARREYGTPAIVSEEHWRKFL